VFSHFDHLDDFLSGGGRTALRYMLLGFANCLNGAAEHHAPGLQKPPLHRQSIVEPDCAAVQQRSDLLQGKARKFESEYLLQRRSRSRSSYNR
jgi:hypothetical protein